MQNLNMVVVVHSIQGEDTAVDFERRTDLIHGIAQIRLASSGA